MRNLSSVSRSFLWAAAALLAVATSTLHAASEGRAMREELSSQLPAGVTLAKASVDQTAAAIKTAVAKDPGNATSLLAAGIIARLPKQNHGQLSCEDVSKMTRAAIASAPNQASQLIQKAASIVPDCADSLNSLLNEREDQTFSDFSVGLGNPGEVGSTASGATAFPPSGTSTAVTTVDVQ